MQVHQGLRIATPVGLRRTRHQLFNVGFHEIGLFNLTVAMLFLCPRGAALSEVGFDLVLGHRLAFHGFSKAAFNFV